MFSGAEVAQIGRAPDSTTDVVGGEAEDRVVASSSPALGTTINLNFGIYYKKTCIIMFQTSTVLVFLVILNIFSLTFFGVDKLKSKMGGWRIPELRLLLVALFAPFGAYAGMLLFHHKTRKVKFLLVPVFLFIHVYVILHFHLI